MGKGFVRVVMHRLSTVNRFFSYATPVVANLVLLGAVIDLHKEVAHLIDKYVVTGYYFFGEQITPQVHYFCFCRCTQLVKIP